MDDTERKLYFGFTLNYALGAGTVWFLLYSLVTIYALQSPPDSTLSEYLSMTPLIPLVLVLLVILSYLQCCFFIWVGRNIPTRIWDAVTNKPKNVKETIHKK